jgi:hypothetical protein
MRRLGKIDDHGRTREVVTARSAATWQSSCARLPAVSRRFPPFPHSRLPTRRRACYLAEEIPWKIRGEVR